MPPLFSSPPPVEVLCVYIYIYTSLQTLGLHAGTFVLIFCCVVRKPFPNSQECHDLIYKATLYITVDYKFLMISSLLFQLHAY